MAKVVSWNLNGLRTLPKSLSETLASFDADICCFQETKVTRSALDSSIAFVNGYNSYFGFSRKREGYSGVATYCKDSCAPVDAVEGLSSVYVNRVYSTNDADQIPDCPSVISEAYKPEELKLLDGEGRAVITRHQLLISSPEQSEISLSTDSISSTGEACSASVQAVASGEQRNACTVAKYLNVINVYCHRLDPDRPERKELKKDFYRLLQQRAEQLVARGDHVLIVGDFNCARERIDHCNPDEDPDFDHDIYRVWMNQFLLSGPSSSTVLQDRPPVFVDLFRWLYPAAQNAFTCWCNYGNTRAINFGTRIDYAVGDSGLIQSNLIADVGHLTSVMGSDHCPVQVLLKNCQLIKASSLPRSCSKFMPEFHGEQQLMHKYVIKRTISAEQCDGGQSKRTRVADIFSRTTTVASIDRSLVDCINTEETISKWNELFNGKGNDAPLCNGHKEPCVLRTSNKRGPNYNRRFYACGRPSGKKGDPNASCNYFRWTK